MKKGMLSSMLQIAILQLDYLMENQHRNANKPKNYAKIPLHKRQQLVDLVCFKKWTIARASIKTSIKLSTAKLILKKYKEEGTFFQKREERLARLHSQQPTQGLQSPSGLQPQLMQAYFHPAPLQQPSLPLPDYGINSFFTAPNQIINPAYYMGMGDGNNGLIFYGGMGYWN